MLRYRLTVLFAFIFILNASSQSKKLWLLTADNAFNAKDYATAAAYYAKVLDDTTVLETYVLPYEAQMVNLKMRSLLKIPELTLHKHKNDSALKNTQQKPKGDTARKVAVVFNPITKLDYIYWQLAQSYRLMSDYDDAIKAFKTVVDRNAYPDARYFYALCLMSKKKYKDALNEFDKYVISNNDFINDSLQKVAQKKETSCYFAIDPSNEHNQIRVKLLDTMVFNKGTASFAPMYYLSPTKIIFTSSRRYGVVNDPEKQDSKYLCDLYYTEMVDSLWTRPVNFGRPVNSALHEGAGYVTPDEVMLFTRWSDLARNESFIYMAKMSDGKFFDAFKLNYNVNVVGYKSMQPFVSFDGSKLFYSSNRPGGLGGFDIWMCNIDENGFIGTPKNLGAPINTSGDEMCPFMHSVSNTLFYASNGLPGFGGLDIFKSSFDVDDSVYAFPKNLGQPINSSKDDAYLIMERTQTRGFFASDREECEGGHCYKIYEFKNEPIFFDIEGIVFDNETAQPIPGALVTIKDVHDNDEPIYIVADDKGHYFSELKQGMEYFMKAQKNTYLGQSASATTKTLTETTHLQQDFYLSKIPSGEVEIEGIEYDFDKATLRPKSKENLDKIVDLLVLNDNLSVMINAHTDSRGNDSYNMRLSQARAQSCVDYLVMKGISKKRLIAKGWGETQPLIKQEVIDAMVPKSDEFNAAHQKNRRTAFKVVGESKIEIINKAAN